MTKRATISTFCSGWVLAMSACHPTGVTQGRLENAFAPIFANLIQTQETKLGYPRATARLLRASADCHRVGPGPETSIGGGQWICTVRWSIPARAIALRDTYDLSVTPDGCFTATADGSEAHVGGRTVTTPEGRTMTNLLFAFDGCFDPT